MTRPRVFCAPSPALLPKFVVEAVPNSSDGIKFFKKECLFCYLWEWRESAILILHPLSQMREPWFFGSIHWARLGREARFKLIPSACIHSYNCIRWHGHIAVDAKVDLQTQRANTRNRYPKRAGRFDLLIDKDEDTSTMVLTTAICPEVTAKRYSRGTRGSPKIALEQCNSPNRWELVKKKNMQIDEVVESRCK
jgi:hypothetical protein